MYKMALTQEILPGKLGEAKAWMRQIDKERSERDPAYKPPKRYITVFGNVHQLVVEWERDKLPEDPGLIAEQEPGKFVPVIVPGRTELLVLKELGLDS